MEENNIENVENIEKVEEKANPAKLLFVLGSGLILIGIAYMALFELVLLDGEKIMARANKSVFAEARKVMKTANNNIIDYNIEKESMTVSGTMTIKSNYAADGIDLSKLSNYKLSYLGSIDKTNNKAGIKLSLVENENNIIGLNSNINGKEVLISLGDIFDKVLKTETDTEIKDLEITKSMSYDKILVLMDKTEKIIDSYLDGKEITKTKEKKEINGKTQEYTKTKYIFKTNDFQKYLYEKYMADDEILEILSNLSNESKNDVKEQLQDEIKANKDSTDTLEIIIFTEGFLQELKEVEITSKTTDFWSEEEVVTKYIITKEGEVYNFEAYEEDEKVMNGSYDMNTSTISINTESYGTKASYTFTIKDDDISGKIIIDETYEKVEININSKNTISGETQTNKTTVEVNITEDEQSYNFTVENDMKITKEANIEAISNTNVVNIEELTDEDQTTIMLNAYEKLTPLIEALQGGQQIYYKLIEG